MSEESSIKDIASQTVVLAFDLVADETVNLPERVASALQSAALKNAIHKALESEAKKLMDANPNASSVTIADSAAAKAIARGIAEKALLSVKDDLFQQIKQSKGAKQLTNNVEQLGQKLSKTAFGVWIDEHKLVLYIVGAVAAFGTAAAMYYFKSGDFVAGFAEGQSKAIKVGSITLKGTLTKFEPSTQTVGAQISNTVSLKPVKISLNLSGLTVGKDGQVTADGKIIVPMGNGLTTYTEGRLQLGDLSPSPLHRQLAPDTRRYMYSIAMGLSYKDGDFSADVLARLEEKQGKTTGKVTVTGQGQTNSFNYRWQLGVNAASDKVGLESSLALRGRGRYGPLSVGLSSQVDSTGEVKVLGKLNLLEF